VTQQASEKGETMKKQCMRALCALIAVTGLGVAVHAQAIDRIEVKVPFQFVAAGKVLPAGKYTISRALEANGGRVLLLTSFENRASVFIMPSQFESDPSEKVSLTFKQVVDHYVLTLIQTGDHAFTAPVPRKELMEAAMKSQSGTSTPASTPGGN
jgi:nitrate reductase beta subunit